MSRLPEFLRDLDLARSMEDLSETTLTVAAHFELTAVASGIIAGPKAASAERFHFARWPQEFVVRYATEELQSIDPIPRWARGTGTPATFSQIVQHLSPRDPGRRVMKIAAEYGCVEGICAPMRAASGAIGLVAMVGDRPPFDAEEFNALVAIAAVVFRTAERIDHTAERAHVAPVLTQREIELLPFLVHGHSDAEIAQLNNIAEATVRFHLKNVRRKIGAVSRTHLAAKVVALGFVSL